MRVSKEDLFEERRKFQMSSQIGVVHYVDMFLAFFDRYYFLSYKRWQKV